VARGALVKAPRTGGSVRVISGIVMIITRHTLLCSYQTCNRSGLSWKVRWNGGCAMLAFFIYDTDTYFTPTLKEEQDEVGIQITNIQPPSTQAASNHFSTLSLQFISLQALQCLLCLHHLNKSRMKHPLGQHMEAPATPPGLWPSMAEFLGSLHTGHFIGSPHPTQPQLQDTLHRGLP
jgi:hypothetical protein